MLKAAIRSLNQNCAMNRAPEMSSTTTHAPLRSTTSAPTTTTYSRPMKNIVVTMREVRPRCGGESGSCHASQSSKPQSPWSSPEEPRLIRGTARVP
ncbi:hypothetical protein SRIMM317S_01490 [Streptomyces rimosus subsp. rimosus]